MNTIKGLSEVTKLLRIMNKRPFVSHFRGDAVVTAKVKGKVVIDAEVFEVALIHDGTNRAHVDVYWESGGYKAYQEIGLYGRMSTNYQEMIFVEPAGIEIKGDSYLVYLQFNV